MLAPLLLGALLVGCGASAVRSDEALSAASTRAVEARPVVDPALAPTVLMPRAPAPPAGVLAMLGCRVVREADAVTWSKERGVSLAEAREKVVRARAFASVADEFDIVSADDIDREVARERAERNLVDDASFKAELEKAHLTVASYRALVSDAIAEMKVTGIMMGSFDVAARDALAARLGDRLRRVRIEERNGRCRELWPSYELRQTVIVGLSATDESDVRVALERALDGGSFTLGAPGVFPRAWTAAVQSVFQPRGLVARLTVLDEGLTLRVKVDLARAPS